MAATTFLMWQVMEQREQIAKDKEDATLVQAEAEEASAQANAKAAECKEIKDSAEADLAEALPALDAAVKCLSKLDKSQIVEVKALKKPPAGVRLTLKAVCIMFGRKPEKITDPDNPQKKIEDYWGPSQARNPRPHRGRVAAPSLLHLGDISAMSDRSRCSTRSAPTSSRRS